MLTNRPRNPKSIALTVRIAASMMLLLLNIACSRELNRKEAAELIIAKEKFPSKVHGELKVNCGRNFWKPYDPANRDSSLLWKAEQELRATYDSLQTQGLLTYTISPGPGRKVRGYKVVTVELTPAGENYSLGTRAGTGNADKRCHYIDVLTCEREFIGVTGIVGDETEARAEYEWHYVRPTPFAGLSVECGSTLAQRESRRFVRYDDGWR